MLNVRKWSRSVLVLLLPVILCFAPAPAAADDIVVFAAASLTNALGEIARGYEPAAKDKVSLSFASSSTLAKQIENGAPANVFISADLDWMDYLEKLKLIAPGSRSDLLGNHLVLIAPKDSDVTVSLAAGVDLVPLLKGGLMATGNPDHVPVGKYAKMALQKLGAWDTVSGGSRGRTASAPRWRWSSAARRLSGSCTPRTPPLRLRCWWRPFPGKSPPAYPLSRGLVQARATPAAARFLDYLKTDRPGRVPEIRIFATVVDSFPSARRNSKPSA